jgi:hypothetical protein
MLAGRHIPELDGGIIATTGEGMPIRRESHSVDGVGMPIGTEQSSTL